jgi:glycosyltransferase involved in cell wall biosynthesis
MPTVSVIIPTQNRPQWLIAAIDSVYAQTLQDFEIIVVLKNADRETHAAADRLSADSRVRVLKTKEPTVSGARNRGLELARGDWVAFLDDDDIWLPDKLAAQLAAARETDAHLVTCNFIQFDDAGDIAPSGLAPRPPGLSFAEALMLDNYVSGGSAALVRTAVMRQLGGFDEHIVASEDWDMWRRLSWDHRIHFVDQVLVKYRRHNANRGSNPALTLPAVAFHFAKQMRDTPPRLHHMLPAVRLQFFNRLMNTLVAEQLIEQQVDPARWRAINAERGGLTSERDELRAERDRLTSERDELRAERDRLTSERDELHAECHALRSDRDALRHVIDTWRRRLRWPLWVRRKLREFG